MKLERLSKNKKVFLILLFISILGFALRIYHLGGPSLWFDELCTMNRAQYSPAEIIKDLKTAAPFPPLYYFLMHYWVKLFGDSEFALRFPSLIFSVLMIIVVFMLARELFDEKVGILSALFVSIAPYSIYYAQEAKMYSMVWLFAALSLVFFYRFTKDNKTVNLLLYILLSAIALYTSYAGFIFIIVENAAFFLLFRGKRMEKWLAGQLAIILLYLPWLGRFLYHAVHRTAMEWIPAGTRYFITLKTVFARIICGTITLNSAMELTAYSILIISAFINITKAGQKRYSFDFKKSDSLLLLWIIVPIITYWLINNFVYPLLYYFTERYIGFIYIPLFILISKGVNKYGTKIKAFILISLLVVMLLVRVFPLYAYNYRVIHGDNWRGALNQLRLRADSDSLILTRLPHFILDYYLKGYETRPLEYLDIIEKQGADKGPSSIFIAYRFADSIDISSIRERLKGYQFMEYYYSPVSGFFWFKKLE